jgi:hypothetical protein
MRGRVDAAALTHEATKNTTDATLFLRDFVLLVFIVSS